jgi:hypothetical protein
VLSWLLPSDCSATQCAVTVCRDLSLWSNLLTGTVPDSFAGLTALTCVCVCFVTVTVTVTLTTAPAFTLNLAPPTAVSVAVSVCCGVCSHASLVWPLCPCTGPWTCRRTC